MGHARGSEGGFTLIELLTVVATIVILAAVALPQFASHRSRAYDALARSDLRNLRTGQEALYAGGDQYAACQDANCVGTIPGFRLSTEVSITATVDNSVPSYSLTSQSNSGTGVVYSFDSAAP